MPLVVVRTVSARKTEEAASHFKQASQTLVRVQTQLRGKDPNTADLADALQEMADGLACLSYAIQDVYNAIPKSK